MNRAGEFLGENGVYPALPLDPALAGKTRCDDLQPEMRFVATLCPGMMAGVEMRIVINSETLGLQSRVQLLAYAFGDLHGPGSVRPHGAETGPLSSFV